MLSNRTKPLPVRRPRKLRRRRALNEHDEAPDGRVPGPVDGVRLEQAELDHAEYWFRDDAGADGGGVRARGLRSRAADLAVGVSRGRVDLVGVPARGERQL